MHGWTWVRQASLRPQRCAVFPHQQSGAYIDTGMDINTWEPHVYISEAAAIEIGKFVGMVPAEQLQRTEQDLDEACRKVHDLEHQVAQLVAFKEAVELIQKEINVVRS